MLPFTRRLSGVRPLTSRRHPALVFRALAGPIAGAAKRVGLVCMRPYTSSSSWRVSR